MDRSRIFKMGRWSWGTPIAQPQLGWNRSTCSTCGNVLMLCVWQEGVTVGHAARIVSSTIGSYSLVGIGSVIVHAELQERSQVAAGAVVHPGSVVQTGQVL